MVDYITVKLWDHIVGVVVWNAARRVANFEYSPRFEQKGINISPLKMPVKPHQIYSFPELNFQTYKGLPGLFADSLPDKFGNALINRWLSEQGRSPESYTPLERLGYLGKRGMGALEFEPAEKISSNQSTKIELDGLVNAAKDALSSRNKLQTNLANDHAMLDILKVGTSAGGARAKAIIAFNEKSGDVRSGQLNALAGYSHWLIKLDGVTEDETLGNPKHYGRIEYAYSLMVHDCGIDMTECRLHEEQGRAHFMTKRFDRVGCDEKLHTQTLCGIAHYDFNMPGGYAYEQLFQTMRQLRLPNSDAEQVFRRMVFNVVARNQDDHTKNFSFIMDKTGNWRLSPAYDMTYSYNESGDYTAQHQLSINGKRDNFTKSDLLKVARSMNIKKPEEIINQIVSVVSEWNKYADLCGIPKLQKNKIYSKLRLLW